MATVCPEAVWLYGSRVPGYSQYIAIHYLNIFELCLEISPSTLHRPRPLHPRTSFRPFQ